MKWSLQEFFGIWRLQFNTPIWRPIRFLLNFPGSLYRAVKQSFFWLFHGYAVHTTWATHEYMEEEILFRIKNYMRHTDESYSLVYESYDEYKQKLDDLVKYWERMVNDYYYNQFPKGEISVKNITIKGKEVSAFEVNRTEEQDKLMRELTYKQDENNEKAMALFKELFHSLWY